MKKAFKIPIPCTPEVTDVTYRMFASAFPPDADPERTRNQIRVLGHVWFSCLVSWAAGVNDMAWIRSELDTAAHLLLD